MLADFAAPRKKDVVCDLGTGCGIIPMILQKHFSPKQIYGVEIQPDAVAQFRAGVEKSGLSSVVIPVLADLRQFSGKNLQAKAQKAPGAGEKEALPPEEGGDPEAEANAGLEERPPAFPARGTFDVVTCNPPYKTAGGGILSRTPEDRIARHETTCTLDDVFGAAAALLRYGGRLCICQRPERLSDAICGMRRHGIEPKRLRLVAGDETSPPWLFLLEGKKGARPHLTVEPLLRIRTGRGFSDEMMQIYNGREKQKPGGKEKTRPGE